MPKLRSDDGSERQNWEVMKALNAKLKIVMALNAKTEKRQWLKSDKGFECQTENSDGSERQN